MRKEAKSPDAEWEKLVKVDERLLPFRENERRKESERTCDREPHRLCGTIKRNYPVPPHVTRAGRPHPKKKKRMSKKTTTASVDKMITFPRSVKPKGRSEVEEKLRRTDEISQSKQPNCASIASRAANEGTILRAVLPARSNVQIARN